MNYKIYTLSLHDALPILTNKKNTAGTYARDVVLSCFFKPGFINNHNCKLNIGSVPTIARIPAIEIYIHIISAIDRKSTRLNSSHVAISYAVFCLKKKSHSR